MSPSRIHHDPTDGTSEHGLGARVFDVNEATNADEIDFESNALPPTWDDGEGLDQTTLTNTILSQLCSDESFNQRYDDILERTMSLSEFRKMFEHRDDKLVREEAMRLLKKKIKLRIDNKYQYKKDSQDIAYSNLGVRDVCFPGEQYTDVN